MKNVTFQKVMAKGSVHSRFKLELGNQYFSVLVPNSVAACDLWSFQITVQVGTIYHHGKKSNRFNVTYFDTHTKTLVSGTAALPTSTTSGSSVTIQLGEFELP
jgi:hypothetical protein